MKQARILSVQIIVFFLLLGIASAALNVPQNIPDGSGACCIPRYAGSIEFISQPLSQADGQTYCNQNSADFVASCYANGELIDQELSFSGCCCNTINPSQIISESPDLYISKNYCDILNQNNPVYNYRGEGNCPQICGSAGDFYEVTGIVYDATTNQPLDDILIRTGEAVTTQTGSDGTFNFGSQLFEEGTYTLTFTSPADYSLTCQSELRTIFVNDDISFDVYMDCEEQEDPIFTCEPDMTVFVEGEGFVDIDQVADGGWSECQQIGNEFLRAREVRDVNACVGSPEGLEYTSVGCENEVVSQACDGTYDPGELCDGGRFLLPNGDVEPSLSCGDIYPGYIGEVTCNGCLQDYSACQPLCDCTSLDQCSSAACATQCAQEPLCLGCDEALSFIPTGAPGGDVFALYEYMETADSRFPKVPIEYHVGSGNVTVRWNYDQTSVCQVTGFDIEVCTQDGSLQSCDTSEPIYSESIIDTSEQSYTFTDILTNNTKYCYNVYARLGDGRRQPAFAENELPCFQTGDAMCMSPQTQGRNCVEANGEVSPAFCQLYSNTQLSNLDIEYESCRTGEVCVETGYVPGSTRDFETGAACVQQQECESCNGLFGLFASYNLPAQTSTGSSIVTCEELLFETQVGFTTPARNSEAVGYGQCYIEESQGLFSFYDECEEVTSCYDYLSKGTCGTDPCFKFSDVETNEAGDIISISGIGCEWKEYQDEVRLGVCQPKAPELHDCSLCDTNEELGFCNKDLCGLYGNCFYKEQETTYQQDAFAFSDRDQKTPACLDVRDLSCALYDTQEECIGIPIFGEENMGVDIDVLYHGIDIETDEFVLGRVRLGNIFIPTARIAGTNQQVEFSNDLFGFGDCRWDAAATRCYKDSNHFTGAFVRDDCDENPSVNCYKDTQAPRTTPLLKESVSAQSFLGTNEQIYLYGSGELFDIGFVVEDEFSTTEDLVTYVSFLSPGCIESSLVPCLEEGQFNCINTQSSLEEIETAYANGCYIYPQHTMEELQLQFENQELSFETGEYQMLYFSEDDARNLEELKSITVFVDSSDPLVLISEIDKEVLNPYEDVYVTDLTISIDVFEDSSCSMQLYSQQNIEDPIIPGIIEFPINGAGEDSPRNFYFTYPQLADGNYTLDVVCVDDFKNPGRAQRNISIEGDASISVLSPIARVFTSIQDVELRISTQYSGTCKFDQTPSSSAESYATSRFFFTPQGEQDGRYLFSSPVPSELGSASGIYLIQTSCSFDTGDITQGQSGDILSFAIDDLSPVGDIYEQDQIYTGSTSPWRNSRNLEVVCDDARTNADTPWSNTGCYAIHYCISSQVSLAIFNQGNPEDVCSGAGNEYGIITADGERQPLSTNFEFTKDQYEYTYLHYFFEDNGGSRSQVYTVNTKVRDTDITEPNVVVE